MSAATFGRKGAGADADMAARRAAFLAEERARAQSARVDAPDLSGSLPRARTYAPEKGIGIAYLLWFFLGGVGAHRFYLGAHSSAIIQLILPLTGWSMLLAKQPIGLLLVLFAGLWILSDAFAIPGMVRKANARSRGSGLGPVFA